MRFLITAILLFLAPCGAFAQMPSRSEGWNPPVGTITMALWPEHVAIERPDASGPERIDIYDGPKAPLRRPVTEVWDVTKPTMTIYPAKGRNTGAAVLVFPGGGYRMLAIDFEGTEVCDWLTPLGITCAVLKYRVPGSGHHWNDACRCHKTPTVPMALQDAQRALALLREKAGQFGIHSQKIGVLGFSAGGHMVAQISNTEALSYQPVDAADEQAGLPDFAVAIYPGHLWSKEGVDLHPRNPISTKAPPTFLLHAQDDPIDDVRHSIAYFLALREAKVPVEMHVYPRGGHAFGLRATDEPITKWPELVERWLHSIRIL